MISVFNTVVPLLEYLLAKKELSDHEVLISAIEVFFAGVETVRERVCG